MGLDIKKVVYYNTTVAGHAGECSKLLSIFAAAGVNLLAYKAVPAGPGHTRFSLFPNDPSKMTAGALKAGLNLDGPYAAILIKGYNDESGALAGIFDKLSHADIKVPESSGFADIRDSYGVVLYLEQNDCDKAMAVLQI